MTSSIQTVCCCGTDNEYVQFEIAPRCTDNSLGCGCGSSDPYEYRSTEHGCGAVDPRDYECSETGQTGCSEPGTNDCEPCGAVYLEKNAYKNMVLHTCDGIDWSPTHEMDEFFDGWWLGGGSSYTIQPCNTDAPATNRIRTWRDSKRCGSQDNFVKVSSDICKAPERLPLADPRQPPQGGFSLSTKSTGLGTTLPEDMTAGNLGSLNVGTGDAFFAIVFRVESGSTTGRRRIFDQGDDNFGLILDGTTLKACFGSEANSAQETNLATGQWHIVIAKRESGTVSARLNGSDFGTNAVSSSDNVSTSQQLKIGATGSGSTRFRGQYMNLIVSAKAFSDTDIEKLEWWLANKYGLLDNLPGGHPYKSQAPQVTQLTPKEFFARLSNHVFKINLQGTVVPCRLTGGGCVGPQEYSIGSSCTTITTQQIMKDCAGNVMFYGPDHPSSSNDYGTLLNWHHWACINRFYSNTTPCEFGQNTDCPEQCDDPDAEYDDNYNYISSEFVKGLHHVDCDDCQNCNPPDATFKFLDIEDKTHCRGTDVYEMTDDGTEWEDPVNMLFGVTNYSVQTRCLKEFDGEPGECCGSDGSSTAPFLSSINGNSPTVTCENSCFLLPDFNTFTYESPFDNCLDPTRAVFCGNDTVNSCCQSSVQPQVSALSVNFGSFELITDSATGSDAITATGAACGTNCALASGGSGTHICYEDLAPGQGRCGTVVSTLPPTEFDPVRCCSASQDPTPGLGCADEGYGSCVQTGYGFRIQGLDDFGVGKVNGGSVVVLGSPSSPIYSKSGTPGVNRGLITTTSYSSSEVADAWLDSACADNSAFCGCPPPQNMACDDQGYRPMLNGVKEVALSCGGTGPIPPGINVDYIYIVTITIKVGTSETDPTSGAQFGFRYIKYATDYDATGTYSFDGMTGGADENRFNYPSTITVS